MVDSTTGTDTGTTDPAGTGGAGGDAWKPPTKEEWESVQKASADGAEALKRANAEAATRKRQLAEQAKANETDAEKVKREATEAAKAGYLPFVIEAKAEAAFLAEGADSAKVARLTRLLDLDKVEVSGRSVTGLAEQVTAIKAEFPELFKAADEGNGRQSGRVEMAGRKPDGTALGPLELLAAQMQGKK